MGFVLCDEFFTIFLPYCQFAPVSECILLFRSPTEVEKLLNVSCFTDPLKVRYATKGYRGVD